METSSTTVHHEPWSKGKIVGQTAPFKVKDIWALRVRLQMEDRVRELALFNLGIESKLRGCDLVVLRVRDGFTTYLVRRGNETRLRSQCFKVGKLRGWTPFFAKFMKKISFLRSSPHRVGLDKTGMVRSAVFADLAPSTPRDGARQS